MHSQASDEELLNMFTRGDRNALGELALRYELPLLGLVRGLTRGRNDVAMDIVQETWMRVIRYGSSFDHRSTVKTWLYRIAINQAKNAAKLLAKQSVYNEIPHAASATTSETELADENRVLVNAMQRLSEAKRTVLLLCYHANMTHEQAAAILEIPLGTLKSRLNAALTELRQLLCPEMHT